MVTAGEAAASGGTGSPLSDHDRRAAQRLRRFVEAGGGAVTAVISYLGRGRVRIVLVAQASGVFGDAVVGSVESAEAVCELAGVPVADGWTRELSAGLAPTPADRRRMAGTGR